MVLYEDNYIVLSESALTIKHFYFPVGSKRIPYDEITAVREEELDFWSGKWRIWGARKLPQWFHLDWNRPGKERCIIVETSGMLDPVLTPDHHDKVLAILEQHTQQDAGGHVRRA